ncbi:MAG: reverse transcriptase domain-containing protein [Actinomycetota bacterium]|nr:reverse transcriptase domain-containing protein [Actinomycetota bacterium]
MRGDPHAGFCESRGVRFPPATHLKPYSYGFRPKRRAQDAIAEIHFFGSPSRNYEWVFEADIEACFDEISHVGLMDRVRGRIGDTRVLGLVKAFLRAGILSEEGLNRETITGTPQGGILSPLLANIALSVLDEHFTNKWDQLDGRTGRAKHRRHGGATYRIVRYADDFLIMVNGTRADAEALHDEVAEVLAPMGLRLSEQKTKVCHIDEGLDFLGWHIQRRAWRGRSGKRAVYTYPSKKALASVTAKVRSLTHRRKHRTLAELLLSVNRVLQGWCNYFRHGVSAKTFSYVDHFTWWRIVRWIRNRHNRPNWKTMRRRHLPSWGIRDGGTEMYRPQTVAIVRYRYRGARIPTPWARDEEETTAPAA